ncbi:hypothetical protein OJF2_04400 [Aquisphaera giovannonii]|uniref:Uncharacterized protein n=1 Tax=Aquisphaera giovannonii TaxID=406548 RepID=A0A5B9VUB5_9BACT|nr:hypothetical protein [Aquisphaera giovannonii]QEH31973.1 hypothetical protein OJF2_04400 [Aquisphaera giovannonii]
MSIANEQGHALGDRIVGLDPEAAGAIEASPPLGAADHDALIRSLTPEKRALFESIASLRRKIGPVAFDVVNALRELREDG